MSLSKGKAKSARASLAVGAVVVGALVATAAPAAATTGHGIGGTVYDNQNYFLSSNVRTVNGSTVQIQLDNRPSRNIFWELDSQRTGSSFAGPTEIRSNSTVVLATNVINGTRFQNKYAQGNGSCFGFCNYNFSGTEYY